MSDDAATIVVTGGAGFIGSATVWKLNTLGIDRILVVDDLGSDEKWRNLVGLRFDDYLHQDEFLRRVESDTLGLRPRAIVHLGACSSTTERDVEFLMRNNYRYTRTLAEWCLGRDVRFIYASSAATYGDGSSGYADDDATIHRLRPLNAYGYSKQLVDLWALRTGALAKITGLKFFNVFGPNEYHKTGMTSVVCQAVEQIRTTGEVKLFKSTVPDLADGDQRRDFVYIKDCVDFIAWLLEHDIGGLYNVGTGQARTFNDLVRAVFAALGQPPYLRYIDMPPVLQGRYQSFTEADMSRVRAIGYTAPFTPLEIAVRDFVTNYLASDTPRYLESR